MADFYTNYRIVDICGRKASTRAESGPVAGLNKIS